MAEANAPVREILKRYLERLRREIPVRRAVLFGSHATGRPHEGSDVDLAVFSEAFEGRPRFEATAFLFERTYGLPIDLQPLGYPPSAWDDPDDPLLAAIRREGVDVDGL